jgi:hypothetical protein
MQEHMLDNRFKLVRTLGVGQYAKVKLGFNNRSQEKVAVKIHK